MLDRKALQALGCWTGYRLERVEWPQGDSRTLSLYLKPVSQIMYCEQCGARCQQIHETTVRRVRDLPLFEYRVVLHVPRRRVWCERCGAARLEKLDWLGRYQRVTERFAKACEKLLQAASVQAVAAFYELGWHTVKSIDKMRLRLAEEGRTMIVVTHEMGFARNVSNHVMFLHQGRTEEEGAPADVLARPQSERLKQFLSGSLK
ncbi:ISBma1, transposase, interruption-N [Burkholderia pseudomallei]|nr:ISBma1, transposase, interruption-N [Burkholderia pseudomallei]